MEDGVARMGQAVFSSDELTQLKALGLGSCIGLCLFDPIQKLGCLVHIVLPQSRPGDSREPGRYADTAIPHVIQEMMNRGAARSRIRTAIAGGAQLFKIDGAVDRLDVGRRNIEAVKKLLLESHLKLIAEDVGGGCGRTVIFNTSSGEVLVKQAGNPEVCLTNLSIRQ